MVVNQAFQEELERYDGPSIDLESLNLALSRAHLSDTPEGLKLMRLAMLMQERERFSVWFEDHRGMIETYANLREQENFN